MLAENFDEDGNVVAIVNNSGIDLHYSSFGEGEPLLLVHGFTQDSRVWEEHGYVSKLQERFQVITVDARGHGLSDRPREPSAYTLDALISDLEAVLDDLGLPAAHYMGYSMGGRIGTALMLRAPARVLSATLIGSSYFDVGFHGFADVDEGDANGFADALEGLTGEPCDRAYRWLLRATGVHSYVALGKQLIHESNQGYLPPKMPLALVVGDKDQRCENVKRMHQELSGSTYHELTGENHESSLACCDLIIKIMASCVGRKNNTEIQHLNRP